MAWFRLNIGKHREGGTTYVAGQKFESNANLLKLNAIGDPNPKFTQLSGRPGSKPEMVVESSSRFNEEELRQMSVAQLRTLAEAEEIELSEHETQDTVIAELLKKG